MAGAEKQTRPGPVMPPVMQLLPPTADWKHPDDVAVYAHACLRHLGLDGWTFHWDRATRRMGCCRPVERRISLSCHYAAAMLPEHPEQLRRTLLHELAHALAWHHQRQTGHGRIWKQWCTQLGIDGERATTRIEDFTPPHLRRTPRYILCHDETGEIFRHYRSMPRRSPRQLRHCYIPGRKEDTLGHLVIRENPAAGNASPSHSAIPPHERE